MTKLLKKIRDILLSLSYTFEGLADLELDNKMLELEKGGENTFTLAYNSLEILLK